MVTNTSSAANSVLSKDTIGSSTHTTENQIKSHISVSNNVDPANCSRNKNIESPSEWYKEWDTFSVATNATEEDSIHVSDLGDFRDIDVESGDEFPSYTAINTAKASQRQQASTGKRHLNTQHSMTPSKKLASALKTQQISNRKVEASNSQSYLFNPRTAGPSKMTSTFSKTQQFKKTSVQDQNIENISAQNSRPPSVSILKPKAKIQPAHNASNSNVKYGNEHRNNMGDVTTMKNGFRCTVPRLIQQNKTKTVRFKFQQTTHVQLKPQERDTFNNYGASTSGVVASIPVGRQTQNLYNNDNNGHNSVNFAQTTNPNNKPLNNMQQDSSTSRSNPHNTCNSTDIHKFDQFQCGVPVQRQTELPSNFTSDTLDNLEEEEMDLSLPGPVTFTRDSHSSVNTYARRGIGIAGSNNYHKGSSGSNNDVNVANMLRFQR